MNPTSISWCLGPDGAPGFTWNPIIGCKHASPGCANCWAERLAATRLDHQPAYQGLTRDGRWTGEQRFLAERLAEPLRRRTPSGIFVCDMSDLFGEGTTNEQIAAVYGVMATCPQHLFYVCTKRAKRRREWFEWFAGWNRLREWAKHSAGSSPIAWAIYRLGAELLAAGRTWPLPNVIELTSVEDQATADERIPDALATPAAVRGLSMEPLISGIEMRGWTGRQKLGLDWVIVGGESGPHARPCRVEWIRSIVRQCREAGVAIFVKQLGSESRDSNGMIFPLRDRAGANPDEWPADLRVRQAEKARGR